MKILLFIFIASNIVFYHKIPKKKDHKKSILNITKKIQKYVDESINEEVKKKRFDYNVSNVKISVIIPVYNGKKFIKRALKSIQNQTLKNIEIIFVDDYSKDDSINLIKKYQYLDRRITLYSNKINKGIFYTKSFGASKAKGEYIMELDQDDLYSNPGLFEFLYELAKNKNTDIIIFEGDYIKELNKIKLKKINREFKHVELNQNTFMLKGLIWDKFIKKDIYVNAVKIIGKKKLQEKIINNEDFIAMLNIYSLSKNIIYCGVIGVIHHDRKDSAGRSQFGNGVIKNNLFSKDYTSFLKLICILTKNTFDDKKKIKEAFEYSYRIIKHAKIRINNFVINNVYKSYQSIFYSSFISIEDKMYMKQLHRFSFNLIRKIKNNFKNRSILQLIFNSINNI